MPKQYLSISWQFAMGLAAIMWNMKRIKCSVKGRKVTKDFWVYDVTYQGTRIDFDKIHQFERKF